MIKSPEKSLSPVKRELVERVKTRRWSITPFPKNVPNQIVARVLTEETEHPSLGRVTRASEKRRVAEAARPRRMLTYDEQQENRPKGDDEEWLDREEFCKQYELE